MAQLGAIQAWHAVQRPGLPMVWSLSLKSRLLGRREHCSFAVFLQDKASLLAAPLDALLQGCSLFAHRAAHRVLGCRGICWGGLRKLCLLHMVTPTLHSWPCVTAGTAQERFARKNEAAELRRAFDALDSKGDGRLDAEELGRVLARLNHKARKARGLAKRRGGGWQGADAPEDDFA